ncbi:galactan 5-O-arabinofuranosyltransferase [Pseudonocardia kunmingensis]|uniref:Galactan 5-O-arabinofuranosyltransferase n=1 Tax=Pseudonocardia kunmingensis TaxID=630975 RepID=A0A543E3T0_9PSEU|nr:galactan 5-O-arabinofuranosyltransferase [Pseudonocardia kunmingensis]
MALGAALLSVQLSRSVVVDPLDRIGQVSGLAALDLRFVVLGLVVVLAAVAASRHPAVWAVVSRLACAAVAGLATGLVAGGVLLALRGTDWPLFANWGDSGQLIRWADDILAGRGVPADYPPAVLHVIARWAELTGDSTASALRTVQVVATALFGPLAYLSWRLVLAPVWALAATLVAAMPMLEPYKPYTTVVLVALVPLLIAFLRVLRRAEALTWTRVALVGVATGAGLGVLFCLYSGWFLWSAPGALVAVLVVFPWRAAPLRGLALLGLAAAGLVAVAWPHLLGLLGAAGTVQDRYFYFDTAVEPAYIAMWRNDLPGDVGPWPPPGELAGVGVFTVLLVVGLGLAVAVAGRRTAVLALCALMAGAWLMRFWIASQMYATLTVQLYPRTTAQILFCLLLLAVFAALYGGRRVQEVWHARFGSGDRVPARPVVTVGALCAALLLALSMGSATADRYLPRDDGSVGLLAHVAQHVRQPDGTCPDYSVADGCAPDPGALLGGGWQPYGEPITRGSR